MNKIILLLYFSTLFLSAIAQTGKDKTIPLFFEKAYLHTDRDVYGQGEDVWFKAYVVNAQTNAPINYSHNLYVELIDPAAKIISRNVIRLENGLGNGDFKLSDSIAAGTYRLRAYTNWMRNFGDNFIFEKDITVLQTEKTAVAATKKNKRATATAAATFTAPAYSVRFFPEGGSMIESVSSVIAVKAEDAAGHGIAVNGIITNGNGITAGNFSCDSLGFGSVVIKPVPGQHYRASVTISGLPYSFPLPEVLTSGFNLALNQVADTLVAMVSCNPSAFISNKGQHLYITAQHGGKTYVSKMIPVNAEVNAIKMPDSWLPEGVACVTISDENWRPLSERLVYVHHPEVVKLNVSTDKTEYQPSGNVNVKIKLSTKEKASLSLAVVDAGTVPVQEGNILSYLNLQSEIKGYIEKPNRYFDTTNVNRFKQMDLLLLTQGWRDFVWKRIADTTLKLTYEPEQGINITGKVRKVWTKSALSGINITMFAPKAQGQKLFWATTDSAGRFAIYNTRFYGYQYMNFTSRRADKLKADGTSKGNSGGWLQVDSLWKDTLAVAPVVKSVADTALLANREADAIIAKMICDLNLKAGHNLKEVTILSNKQGRVLPVQKLKITLADQKEYSNLAEYLIEKIPWAHVITGACSYCDTPPPARPDRPFASFLFHTSVKGVYSDKSPIDYCHLCQEDYLMLPMNNILDITINSYNTWGGWYASVSLVLRPGALKPKGFFDNTIADMVGYYKAREFYKPNSENPDPANNQRINTIYWEPNITTDQAGKATVSFNNTTKAAHLRLIVEGITDKGDAVTAQANYKVK